MNITIKYIDNDFAYIKIDAKSFDFETLHEAKEVIIDIIDNERQKIILDLRAMKFMDSIGLSLIVSIFKYTQSVDGVFKLCALAKQPSELITIIGLDKLLTLSKCHMCLVANKEEEETE